MTVPTSTARADYVGNGATVAFAAPFYFTDPTHLTVYLVTAATGASSVLVLNSDYTVAGTGVQGGGTVTCTVAPTVSQRLAIVRNVPQTQNTHYVPNDPFPAASHENALDLLTMQVQQLQLALNAALQFPLSDSPNFFGSVLPAAAARANLYLGFDANGNLFLQNGNPAFTTNVTASGTGAFGSNLSTAGYLKATGPIPATITGAVAAYMGTASGFPYMALVNNGAAADTKVWDQYADANTLHLRAINDAMTVSQDWLQVLRSGATVTSVTLPNGLVGIGVVPTAAQGQLQMLGSANGGIKLGNVNNTYANALDWYEEGSITPDLYVGGLITDSTYSARSGSYTRIGNRIFFDMLIQINVKGAFTGSLSLGLLPYAAVAGSFACAVKGSGLSLSSPGWLIAEGGNSQRVSLFTSSALGGVVALDGILANGCAIEVCGHFRVA